MGNTMVSVKVTCGERKDEFPLSKEHVFGFVVGVSVAEDVNAEYAMGLASNVVSDLERHGNAFFSGNPNEDGFAIWYAFTSDQ